MRNKFTELISAGVAAFNSTPIAQETPQYCPVCHTYNNVWGIITDTHMSCLENGRRVITGTFVSDPAKWTKLLYSQFWGGVRFDTAGYMSLSEFLYNHGLDAVVVDLNGQPAMELVPCDDCPVSGIACKVYTTTETKFPQPIERLGAVRECFEADTLSKVAKKLNASIKVPGNHWHVCEDKIVGSAYGMTVILDMSFDKGTKVDCQELTGMFESEGMGNLFFRKFPRYFALDSDDRKWQAVLRENENNRVFVKNFEDLSPKDWFEEAKVIIETIS